MTIDDLFNPWYDQEYFLVDDPDQGSRMISTCQLCGAAVIAGLASRNLDLHFEYHQKRGELS